MLGSQCAIVDICTDQGDGLWCSHCRLTVYGRCMSRRCPIAAGPAPKPTRGVNSGRRSCAGNSPTHFLLKPPGLSGNFSATKYSGNYSCGLFHVKR